MNAIASLSVMLCIYKRYFASADKPERLSSNIKRNCIHQDPWSTNQHPFDQPLPSNLPGHIVKTTSNDSTLVQEKMEPHLAHKKCDAVHSDAPCCDVQGMVHCTYYTSRVVLYDHNNCNDRGSAAKNRGQKRDIRRAAGSPSLAC